MFYKALNTGVYTYKIFFVLALIQIQLPLLLFIIQNQIVSIIIYHYDCTTSVAIGILISFIQEKCSVLYFFISISM